MPKEYKPIYHMGSNSPVAIASRNEDTGLIESNNLLSIFSGADITGFFNGEVVPLMSATLTRKSMTCIFTLSDNIKDLLFGDGWIPFHLIGISERGNKGLISGTCKPVDFDIFASIDELNIEAKIYFESSICEYKGWFGKVDKETDEEIGKLWWSLINKKVDNE